MPFFIFWKWQNDQPVEKQEVRPPPPKWSFFGPKSVLSRQNVCSKRQKMCSTLSTFSKKCAFEPKSVLEMAKNVLEIAKNRHFRHVGDKKIAIEEGAFFANIAFWVILKNEVISCNFQSEFLCTIYPTTFRVNFYARYILQFSEWIVSCTKAHFNLKLKILKYVEWLWTISLKSMAI